MFTFDVPLHSLTLRLGTIRDLVAHKNSRLTLRSPRRKQPKTWFTSGTPISKYPRKEEIMKRVILVILGVALASCNVTRTITTQSQYYQKGDTTCTIVTKTIETYDASKKL